MGEDRIERECPWCAELILVKARVCKHCGRDVVPVVQPQNASTDDRDDEFEPTRPPNRNHEDRILIYEKKEGSWWAQQPPVTRALGTAAAILLFIVFLVNLLLPDNKSVATHNTAPQSSDGANVSPPRHDLPTATVNSAPPSVGDYQSLIANVWVGKKLYLRTDKTYIGTIADIESDHRFETGAVADAVLVDFDNGARFWVPRKTLQQIYVTK
jgi:hypothetical protein